MVGLCATNPTSLGDDRYLRVAKEIHNFNGDRLWTMFDVQSTWCRLSLRRYWQFIAGKNIVKENPTHCHILDWHVRINTLLN